ncbi:MAG TPA: Wzz/FepE/Etk N-terminal domain-containing protein [Gemmatimonadales bacterium]|nr:Wzz/FepE/Etk N-terminal domain-containing protein [Gemmatimonadales bacterium]
MESWTEERKGSLVVERPPPHAPPVSPYHSIALDVVGTLLRRWRLVLGLPLGAAVVAGVLSFLVAERYAAMVSFAPEQPRRKQQLPGAILGIAAQFGVDLTGTVTESPSFYIQVMQSRPVMTEVLEDRYERPGAPGDSATLLEILRAKGKTYPQRLNDGIYRLTRIFSMSADNQTQIVRLTVTTQDPALSADVANRFVRSLTEFNLQRAQNSARERRRFTEDRLAEAAAALQAAEDSLYAFLQRNRMIDSPELQYEQGRRQRQVSLRQEMYVLLTRASEEARIDESNDVPTLTVIEPAVPPTKRSSPSRRVWVMVALLAGATLAVGAAVMQEYLEGLRRHEADQVRTLAELWARTRAEMKRMLPGRRATV